jgi:dihydrofolate reductase
MMVCLVYQDIQKLMNDFKDQELMIIGGQEIYKLFFLLQIKFI